MRVLMGIVVALLIVLKYGLINTMVLDHGDQYESWLETSGRSSKAYSVPHEPDIDEIGDN